MAIEASAILPADSLEELRVQFNNLITDVDGISSGNSFVSSIIFEGATADANETVLFATDPTADRVITLPDVTGTVITTGNASAVLSAPIPVTTSSKTRTSARTKPPSATTNNNTNSSIRNQNMTFGQEARTGPSSSLWNTSNSTVHNSSSQNGNTSSSHPTTQEENYYENGNKKHVGLTISALIINNFVVDDL